MKLRRVKIFPRGKRLETYSNRFECWLLYMCARRYTAKTYWCFKQAANITWLLSAATNRACSTRIRVVFNGTRFSNSLSSAIFQRAFLLLFGSQCSRCRSPFHRFYATRLPVKRPERIWRPTFRRARYLRLKIINKTPMEQAPCFNRENNDYRPKIRSDTSITRKVLTATSMRDACLSGLELQAGEIIWVKCFIQGQVYDTTEKICFVKQISTFLSCVIYRTITNIRLYNVS